MRGPLAERAIRLGPAIVSFPIVGAALAGDGVVAVVSRNLRPARVALVDLQRPAASRSAVVPTGDGAWGVAADGRGGLWLGMFGARGRANLYRLDLASLAVEAAAAIDAVHLWDLAVGADGVVYGVSDGPAAVFAYDPVRGRAEDLGVVRRGPEASRSITVVGRTLLVGGRSEGRALLRAYDLDRRTTRSILPAALREHLIVYSLATDGRRVAMGTRGPGERDPAVALLSADRLDGPAPAVAAVTGESVVDSLLVEGAGAWATMRPSGALVRVEEATATAREVARPVPLAEQRGVFRSGEVLVGAAADGRLWETGASGGVVVRDLLAEGAVEGGAEIVQSLAADGGRVWAGGTFGVARRDASGVLARTPVPGEPKDIALVEGTAYLALYPIGEIWAAADDGPPRRVARLPVAENRPLALHHHAQRGVLLIGTAADRGGGGGFHVLELASGRLRSRRDPIGGGQAVPSVSAAGDLALLGGRDGTLVAWHLDDDAEVWRVALPVPDGGPVSGLVALGGLAHLLTARGWHLVVDLTSRRVVHRARVGETGGGLVATAAGVYGVDADRLLGFPPAGGSPAVLLEGLAPRHWASPTLAVDGDDLLVLHGSDVVRVSPRTAALS